MLPHPRVWRTTRDAEPHCTRPLRWVVVIPGLSLDKALEEIRLGQEHGACGIFMRAVEGDRRLSDGYCVIFRSTPPCSWYTQAALTMPCRLCADLTSC